LFVLIFCCSAFWREIFLSTKKKMETGKEISTNLVESTKEIAAGCALIAKWTRRGDAAMRA
jgi:hypothetical protein